MRLCMCIYYYNNTYAYRIPFSIVLAPIIVSRSVDDKVTKGSYNTHIEYISIAYHEGLDIQTMHISISEVNDLM